MEEPTSNLIMINTWVKDSTRWETKLAAHNYDFNGPNTLIIDEAQLTYWDTGFWNSYLKAINDRSRDRIILFVSWASPTSRVSVKGPTPIVVPATQSINLRPTNHLDHLPPVGLLLSKAEFNEMVDTAFPDGRFTAKFLDHVFHLTAGHAGAVNEVLRIIMADAVSLCIKPQYSLTIVSSHTVNSRRKLPSTP